MKVKKYAIYSVIVVAIVLCFYAVFTWGRQGHLLNAKASTSTPTAYVESDVINASFKVAGRVDQMVVQEGQQVKKGQMIARLESKELQNKVAQAKAAVETANANVAQAEAGVAQAQAGVTQAQAGKVQASASVTEAQAAVNAAQVKKSQGEMTVDVTANTASSKIEEAQAAAKAAKAKWEALKSGARPEEIQQAKVNMQITKEALATVNKSLKRVQLLHTNGLATEAALDQATIEQKQAQAKYDAAVQQLQLVQKGSRQQEIDAAKALYQQALASVKEAQAGQGQVALQQEGVKAASAGIDQAQGAVAQAQGAVAQADGAIEQATATLTQAKSKVKAARSQVSQAKATLQEAQTYFSYTVLRASVDGVIQSKSLNIGEMASAGFPVYALETTSQRWAKFYVTETELNGLKVGDPVQVTLLSGNTMVKGKVSVIDAAADFAIQKPSQTSGDTDIRSFGVKVELLDLPNTIPTGSTVIFHGKGVQ